ncbi:unnamed protein product [Cyprideis torosa]|uniref:Uncharacterized protein n=1 Tax=Cyprideis torosa TaxID=163714 RepID=A0A7R8WAE6_9CRUS|nr:unnamed protein product [Cyprideis torosa]CAG0890927.1 unnamed protein product [Cyprideis torosa]
MLFWSFWLLVLSMAGHGNALMDPICADDLNCFLPDCKCAGTDPPNDFYGIPIEGDDLPQIVLLSFDDAIREDLFLDYYSKLFNGTFKNPNGCPISGTFFVSHESTDYVRVHQLREWNCEIATHSFTHQPPASLWAQLDYDEFRMEMSEVRQTFARFGQIEEDLIVGARPANFSQAMALLEENFNRRYTSNKGPLGLYTHASWFMGEWTHNFDALVQFIQNILALPGQDVFIISISQLITYLKDPQLLSIVSSGSIYPEWCPATPNLPSCTPPGNRCQYGQIYMNSCVDCPPNYPGVGNPLGN